MPEKKSRSPSAVQGPTSSSRMLAPDPASLDRAFSALRVYAEGSSRAALVPIDEAVPASLADPAERGKLQQRLLTALDGCASAQGHEYICSKLSLIGNPRSVSALGRLLGDACAATAARTALEAIGGSAAIRTLRTSLSTLQGQAKIGVVNSLANLRDQASTAVFCNLLDDANLEIAAAAISALGDLGSKKAAAALRAFAPRAPRQLRLNLANAVLRCAERLLSEARVSDAEALCRYLAVWAPPHVLSAATRLLEGRSRAGRISDLRNSRGAPAQGSWGASPSDPRKIAR